jgi:AcrR family transcriptional regulator
MPMTETSGAPRQSLRDRNRQATRRAILQAAQVLMTRDGVARASMVEVAALAGVSDTTVFNYFKTKAELLDAVVEELASATNLATLLAARPLDEGPFTALRNVIRTGTESDNAENDTTFDAAHTYRFVTAVRADTALWNAYLRITYDTGEALAALFAQRVPQWAGLQARAAAHATAAALSVLLTEVTEDWTADELVAQMDALFARLDRAWPR